VRPLGDLLVALAEALPAGAGAPELGAVVQVTSIDMALPVEARIERDGVLRASLPRGRMATGFHVPHGQLRARFAPTGRDG
jgi:hypothetical protein